jgi:hypothetical protein
MAREIPAGASSSPPSVHMSSVVTAQTQVVKHKVVKHKVVKQPSLVTDARGQTAQSAGMAEGDAREGVRQRRASVDSTAPVPRVSTI